MIQYSEALLKTFIAPAIDQKPLVDASILPDLRTEIKGASDWMFQYFTSSFSQSQFSGETKLYAESAIARIQIILSQYDSVRLKTFEYADGWHIGNPNIGLYLAVVGEWEGIFINLQTIYDLLKRFFGVSLTAGDREDRSRLIANRIKHSAEDIEDGKTTDSGMPLWLTATGLSTISASVTFSEVAEQIRILTRFTSCLAVPSEAKQCFEALDNELKHDPNYEIKP